MLTPGLFRKGFQRVDWAGVGRSTVGQSEIHANLAAVDNETRVVRFYDSNFYLEESNGPPWPYSLVPGVMQVLLDS